MAAAMEIRVDDSYGMVDGSIVSIRFGSTRRQAPLETVRQHPLKFPMSPEACCEPLKIDVLQPVATARLVLQPHEASYRMDLDTKGSDPMSIGLSIAGAYGNEKSNGDRGTASPPPMKYQDAAASAREYLELHGLLRYVQALLHAVIQVRPKDPYQFMMQQLGAAKPNGESRPLTPTPPPYPKESGRGPRSKQNVVAPTNLDAAMEAVVAEATGVLPPTASPSPAPPPSSPLPEPIKPSGETTSEKPPAPAEEQPPAAESQPAPAEAEALETARELPPAEAPAATETPAAEAAAAAVQTPVAEAPVAVSAPAAAELPGAEMPAAEAPTAVEAPAAEAAAAVETPAAEAPAVVESAAVDTPAAETARELPADLLPPSADKPAAEPPAALVAQEPATSKAPDASQEAAAEAPKEATAAAEVEEPPPPPPKPEVAPPPPEEAAPPLPLQASDVEAGIDVHDAAQVDEVRLKMKSMLETACQSGALTRALESVMAKEEQAAQASAPSTSQAPAEKSRDEVDAVRAKLTQILEQACESGALAEALQKVVKEVQPAPQLGAVEEDKEKKGNAVATSAGTGEAIAKSDADEVLEMRQRLRALLEATCESGELEKALKTAIQDPAPTQTAPAETVPAETAHKEASDKAPEIDAMVKKMRALLENACESGELEKALSAVQAKKPTETPQADKIAEVQAKMRDMLEKGAESGELQKALEAASREKLRVALRSLLETSCDSGALEKALQAAQQPKAAAAAEAKAEPAAETKTEAAAEEAKAEPAPEAKAEEAKAEPAAEVKAEEAKAEPAPEAKAEEAKAKPAPESKAEEPKPEPEAKAEEVKAEPAPEAKPKTDVKNVEDMRQNLRNLLETSCSSGQLESALQVARAKQLKEKLRTDLEKSLSNGALEAAVARHAQAPAVVESAPVGAPATETARELPADLLAPSAEKPAAEPPAALVAQETSTAWDVGTSAAPQTAGDTGATEQKPAETEQKSVDAVFDAVDTNKDNVISREEFKEAAKAGILAEASAAPAPEQPAAEQPTAPPALAAGTGSESYSVEELRVKMRGLLENATESGDLGRALEKVGKSPDKDPKAVLGDVDTEQMRVNMRNQLEKACDSGLLQTALEKVIGMEAQQGASEQTPQAADSAPMQPTTEQELKAKMRQLLEKSAESGELAEALLKVIPPTTAAEEAPKAATAEAPATAATETPAAVAPAAEETPVAWDVGTSAAPQAPADVDIDALKGKMRGMLEQACESGQLRTALNAVTSAAPKEEKPGALNAEAPKAPAAEATEAAKEEKTEASAAPTAEVSQEEKAEAPKAEAPKAEAPQAPPAEEAPKAGAPEPPKAEVREAPKEEEPQATSSTSVLDSQEQIKELQSVVMGMKEDNMSLHHQVDQLEAAMKDLKTENKALVETLRKRPSSATQRPS